VIPYASGKGAQDIVFELISRDLLNKSDCELKRVSS
jgi:hypothetical protein